MVASGIRLGTPAITSRGLGVAECREVGRIICEAFDDIEERKQIPHLRDRVRELTSRYGVP
jgi:glycine hydroxymethyltransferase